MEPLVGYEEVDETGPGDLRLLDEVGPGKSGNERVGDLARVQTRARGEHEGNVGGEIAVFLLPRRRDDWVWKRGVDPERRSCGPDGLPQQLG